MSPLGKFFLRQMMEQAEAREKATEGGEWAVQSQSKGIPASYLCIGLEWVWTLVDTATFASAPAGLISTSDVCVVVTACSLQRTSIQSNSERVAGLTWVGREKTFPSECRHTLHR